MHEFQVATVLALAAGSLVAAVVTWNRTGQERRFAAFLAICAGLLAFDKATGAVNRLHAGLHRIGIGDPPYLRGIDDLVLLAGMAVALVFLLLHWRILRAFTPMAIALALGGVFAAGALAIDSFGPEEGMAARLEDVAELAMAVAFLAAVLLLARRHGPLEHPGSFATPAAGPSISR